MTEPEKHIRHTIQHVVQYQPDRLAIFSYAHVPWIAPAQRNKTMQRNFQGYSTFKDVEICGFGIPSISQTANSYRQNVKDLEQYTAKLSPTFQDSLGFALTFIWFAKHYIRDIDKRMQQAVNYINADDSESSI